MKNESMKSIQSAAAALAVAALLSLSTIVAAQSTPSYCVPTSAVADTATAASFTAFASNERLEVRSGKPGAADWEWGLGTNTQNASSFQNINNIDWPNGASGGLPINFTLTYNADGSGVITLFNSSTNAQLATKTFPAPAAPATGLRVGNAIRLWVKTNAGIGVGAKIRGTITAIDGNVLTTPIALETTGDNTYNEQVSVIALAAPANAGTMNVKGQMLLSWPGAASAIPTGSRLNATINAGTITCASTGPQAQAITNFASTPASPITYAPTPNNTLTLSATGGVSGNPVTFASTTPAVCTAGATTQGANNSNTATVTIVAAGTCTITADQAGTTTGNPTYSAAPQLTTSITINKASQSITGFNPPQTLSQAVGSTITLTATGGASTNPVVFTSTTTGICTTGSTTLTNGTSSATLTIQSAGVCGISANQAGDSNYAPATTVTANITINVPAQLYYIHPDHLGTPRAITKSTDNTKVWEWKNDDPFGNNAPDENPNGANGAMSFKYNLRFPGQYYDQETNTDYNYFRDYDPTTGRYVQSDPIGLKGGINTFSYVEASPIGYVDFFGLQTSLLRLTRPPAQCCNSDRNDAGSVEGVTGIAFSDSTSTTKPNWLLNWMRSESAQQSPDELINGTKLPSFPGLKTLENCSPGQRLVEPATNKRYKGGTSIQQEYFCPCGQITRHTVVLNGTVVHDHFRPGPPKSGGD